VELSFNGVRLPVHVEQKKGPVAGCLSSVAKAKGGTVISRACCNAQALCAVFTMLLAASDQILDRQLRISGDGLRLITITGNPPFNNIVNLNFTTVP